MTDKGWTPEDMSAEIFRRWGVKYATSERTIYRVLKGFTPTIRKQFAIAQVLDTVPSQLWEAKRKVPR